VFLTKIRLVNLRVSSGSLSRLPGDNPWLPNQSLTASEVGYTRIHVRIELRTGISGEFRHVSAAQLRHLFRVRALRRRVIAFASGFSGEQLTFRVRAPRRKPNKDIYPLSRPGSPAKSHRFRVRVLRRKVNKNVYPLSRPGSPAKSYRFRGRIHQRKFENLLLQSSLSAERDARDIRHFSFFFPF
jgi:hypothetical protein